MLSALLLFGVAAVLRFVLAGERGLWADELFSLAMATGHSLEHPAADADPAQGDFVEQPEAQPPAAYARYLEHEKPPAGARRVIRAVQLSDTSPPLYYLLLNLWTRGVGTSDLALRLFSVLWALAAFPLIWLLADRVGGRPAAFSSALLYAVAPLSLYYSVEGRMYAMLWFLAIAFIWLTWRLHELGTRRATLALWILAGAAGFLTHYFFAFVWFAGVLWLGLHPGRSSRSHLAAAVFVIIGAVLPWYAQLPASLSRWRVTGSWLNGPLSFAQALSAPVLLGWNLIAGRGVWGGSRWSDRFLAALLLVLAWALWRRGLRPLFSQRLQLLWLWVLAACFGPIAFDLLRGTFASLMARYALAGLPAAMLLLGFALSRLPPRPHLFSLGLVVVAWLRGVRDVFRNPRSWEPYVQIGHILSTDAQPGDLVIVHSIPSGVIGVARYMTASVPLAAWVGQLDRRQIPQDLDALLPGRRRVALVRVHHLGEAAPEEDWLRSHAKLTGQRKLQSADLLYFGPQEGTTFEATRAASDRR
ncbi:MAG: glycosyltransferase family 39 protein [Gemmatimonadales bacterium]